MIKKMDNFLYKLLVSKKEKIIAYINRKLSVIAIKFSIKTYLYPLSILVFIFQILSNKKVNYIFNFRKNSKFIILLEKDGFNQDTALIDKYMPDIKCVSISREFIKAIAKCFLPEEIDDNNYQSCSNFHKKAKNNLLKFYDYLFKSLPNTFKPKAFLTGNFGYFAEQELFKAAYRNGIKGIAIHKECLKTPGRINLFNYIYSVRRSKFGGSLMLVYNKKEYDLQKKAGVIDLNKSQIKIIGSPRIDQAHSLRKANLNFKKHRVVFFGFGLKTGLPSITRKSNLGSQPHYEYLQREHEFLSWKNLLSELCQSYLLCCQKYPEVEFFIKLKDGYRDKKFIIDFFEQNKKPNNLKILTKVKVLSLLENASIVIGFNSTSIFEAIARGSTVICPQFGECNLKRYKPYFIDFSNTEIILVKSGKSFEKIISKLIQTKPIVHKTLSENKKYLLKNWVGNHDGKSTSRLISSLKNELN